MKRSALAMAAAIALALSVPGMASAIVPGVLDQSNPADTPSAGSAHFMAQTFTAGKSGLLTYVQLWLEHTDALSVSIESTTASLPDAILSNSDLATPTDTPGWVMFPIIDPVPMNAGTTYAIVFNTNQNGADTAYGSGDTYAGGQAYQYSGGSWVAVSGTLLDFAFQTYVDPQTTTLQWDKAQVVVGVATPLTLTETLVFPTYTILTKPVQPAVPGPTWSVTSVNLPTWFSVASVVCSSQILPADCTPANVAPGKSINLTPDGNPVTLTLTGTATATAVGTATGNAQGCVAYYGVGADAAPAGQAQPQPVLPTTVCVSGQATVNVVAPNVTPGPTPPPTSTDRAPAPTEPGFILWLLPFCLAAMGGSLFLFSRRHGRIR